MIEENTEFLLAKNVFYNPAMHFCRSFCSLAVGAISEKIDVLDAFCASGIRGIRYATENRNVKNIGFLDANDNAILLLKKNLKKNKVKGKIANQIYEKFFTKEFLFYDLIEIDPFGTPVPYLWSTFYAQQKKKEFYLSVTATDTAVLCGPQSKACLKNYHSKNLNNEFTHETGTRILIKKIIENANEFDFGCSALFSLSDRHYIKIMLKVERGAEKAYRNLENMGYASYCNNCGWRGSGKRIKNNCETCDSITDYAGPLWLGELHDKKFLERMLKLNNKREYAHQADIEKTLKLMLGEIGMPTYFYDLHVECRRIKAKRVPKMENVINALQKKGFMAARTHFAKTGVKTDAGVEKVHELILQ